MVSPLDSFVRLFGLCLPTNAEVGQIATDTFTMAYSNNNHDLGLLCASPLLILGVPGDLTPTMLDMPELLSGEESDTFFRRLENVLVFFGSTLAFFAGDGDGAEVTICICLFGDGFSNFVS